MEHFGKQTLPFRSKQERITNKNIKKTELKRGKDVSPFNFIYGDSGFERKSQEEHMQQLLLRGKLKTKAH